MLRDYWYPSGFRFLWIVKCDTATGIQLRTPGNANSVACSYACSIARTDGSANGAPTICRPIGKLSL